MLFTTQLKNTFSHGNVLLLLVILSLLISIFIRFRPVYEGTFPYLYDQGRDYLDVKKIVDDGDFTFIGPTTGVSGIFHGPLHYYLLALGYFVSGGNPSSGVILTILAQLIAGLACYLLGAKYISRRFGALLSVLFLLSVSSLRISNTFWNPYWIPPLMVVFYFSLLVALQKDSRYWLVVGLIAGLIAQFEIAFGIFLIPFLFFAGILAKKNILTNLYFWGAFPLFGVAFLPLIAFDIKNNFPMVKSAISVLTGKYSALGESIPLVLRFQYRFNEIWRMSFESLTPFTIINYLFFAIAVAYLGYIIFKRKKEQLYYSALFLLLPFLMYVGFMFYDKPAWSYYWIGISVSFYFFLAYALTSLSYISRPLMVGVATVIGVFVIVSFIPQFQKAEFITREPGIYINQLRVIDTIYEDAQGEPFGAWVYTPPVYDHTYRYLFYWRGKQRGFTPQETTSGNYYLIIEENKDRPWEIEGWKKTKVKANEPVWVKTFPGNITVEKHIHEKNN